MSSVLEGFKVINVNETSSKSQLTLFQDSMRFNKATAAELNFPAFVRLLINEFDGGFKLAVEVCNGHCKEAIRFSELKEKQNYAINIKHPATMVMVRRFLDFSHEEDERVQFKVNGTYFLEENVIIYDLSEARKEIAKSKKKTTNKKTTNKEGDVS